MKQITHDAQKFFGLREFVLNVKSYEEATEGFKWPRLTKFNWALDYFDVITESKEKPALIFADVEGKEEVVTYDKMMKRSNQVANFLNDLGLEKGDRGEDGQICCAIYPVKPIGLLTAYEDSQRNKDIFKGGWCLTGDTAYIDKEGYVHFVGRVDDVFKSLDYRISLFEKIENTT